MNNMEWVIHIGYHRTGTTFLQNHVFPVLALNKILSPDVRYLAESKTYDPDQFINILRTNYLLNKYDKTIISQETLSGRGDGNPIWDKYLIADRLQETFPKGKIIIVIRNQIDYILSLYSFRVVIRGLERKNLQCYLDEKSNWLFEKLQYDKLVTHYISLFNKNNILVMLYENFIDNIEDFINTILKFMNIELPVYYDTLKVNSSPRNSKIITVNRLFNYPISILTERLLKNSILSEESYIRTANAYFSFKNRVLNPVLMSVYNESIESLHHRNFVKDRCLDAFTESNTRLSRLINVDLSRYSYPV